MTPEFTPQWTVPRPPDSGDRPIRADKVTFGVLAAVAGHLVSFGLGFLTGQWFGFAAEVVTGAACVTIGVVWMVRRDRGFGIGLVVGWALGLVLLPAAGLVLLMFMWNQGPGA